MLGRTRCRDSCYDVTFFVANIDASGMLSAKRIFAILGVLRLMVLIVLIVCTVCIFAIGGFAHYALGGALIVVIGTVVFDSVAVYKTIDWFDTEIIHDLNENSKLVTEREKQMRLNRDLAFELENLMDENAQLISKVNNLKHNNSSLKDINEILMIKSYKSIDKSIK